LNNTLVSGDEISSPEVSRNAVSGSVRRTILTALPVLAASVMMTALPAQAADPQGFLYGKITTRSGSTYEGRLRWGKEEAFWGDHFNSIKGERPYVDQAPRRKRGHREAIKIFGITIGSRWEGVSDDRSLIARFGDIRKIETRRHDEAVLIMKNGSEIEIDGGSNDLGGKIHIWDREIGKVEVRWDHIEEVEFLPAPPNLEVDATRLYGTVHARTGTFKGFIQWDQDECMSIDKLDGETRDSELSIEMGNIRTLERHSRDSTRVVLYSDREFILDDSNDVNSENRGIFVDDPRYGRVLVKWNAFERLDFEKPRDTGPRYDDFAPAKALWGTVTDEDGKSHRGRIVYDLDEAESWELLNGDYHDVRYYIPFDRVASIIPENQDSSRVVLGSGEELTLEDRVDMGDGHDGVLVLAGEESKPLYLAWNDIRRIDFDQ